MTQNKSPANTDMNEKNRLRVLESLHILDTASDSDLDKYTKLLNLIFDVPIALISLVDSERQWFKSRLGIEECSSNRDIAFCSYTIQSTDIFEVINPTADERFKNNPFVKGDVNLRYYCGAPVMIDGEAIGSLCMIDTKKREPLTDNQREILIHLAAKVADEISAKAILKRTTDLLMDVMRQVD
ncbi:hypothetical protein LCGC14_0952250 [marine sediment metagenome]|uniref:GAF domain-containing protein n=1 Tax=marine sediment metagenome TaxID=412755 RepID=A0A0F9NLM2_9ZZZZ